MKSILLLAVTALFTCAVAAQTTTSGHNQHSTQPEYFIMENGKMMQVTATKKSVMEKDISLANGTWIHPDGSYQTMNGKKYQLKNGECMDINGIKYRSERVYLKKKRSDSTTVPAHEHQQNSGGHHH